MAPKQAATSKDVYTQPQLVAHAASKNPETRHVCAIFAKLPDHIRKDETLSIVYLKLANRPHAVLQFQLRSMAGDHHFRSAKALTEFCKAHPSDPHATPASRAALARAFVGDKKRQRKEDVGQTPDAKKAKTTTYHQDDARRDSDDFFGTIRDAYGAVRSRVAMLSRTLERLQASNVAAGATSSSAPPPVPQLPTLLITDIVDLTGISSSDEEDDCVIMDDSDSASEGDEDDDEDEDEDDDDEDEEDEDGNEGVGRQKPPDQIPGPLEPAWEGGRSSLADVKEQVLIMSRDPM